MSSIGFVSTNNDTSSIGLFSSDSVQNKLDRINGELKDLPSILNPETITKLKDGEYKISLKEYHDLNSYRTTMSALYGNKSASKFQTVMNNLFETEDKAFTSAKEFINALEEKGIEKKSALKLYTAMKSYSAMNTYLNNSFVSAVI